jgi:hypothetical protein
MGSYLLSFVVFLIFLYLYLYFSGKQEFVLPRNEIEEKRLNELKKRGDTLIEYTTRNNYPDHETANTIRKNWEILKKEGRIGITPNNTDTPGFVINKNDAMQICLTKRPDAVGDLDDLDAATFVLIHEIAHLGAKEYQHGNEFLGVFKKLLRASINAGIWTYRDYSLNPQIYCEYNINATPEIPEKFRAIFR